MKTVIRKKGDLLTAPPIATIQANPLVTAGFITSLFYSEPLDLSVHFNLVNMLQQLERGDIDFFTTTNYLISDTPALAVGKDFTTDTEIEA